MEKRKSSLGSLGKGIIDVLPCSLLLAFTFFVFGPLQMYLTNKNEFWFKLTHILPTIIISFLLALIFFTVITLIIPIKFRKYYVALLFGIGFALYIQGNFINLDYGVLDGAEIDWSSYGYKGVINTIIWIVCILLPVILTKIWVKQVRKATNIISIFIFAVQVLTTGVLLFSTDFSTDKKISVTRNDIYSLSPDKNEIVFIIDTFDADYMNKILEKYPEYKDRFKDFTYYENALGTYPTTKGAAPHIYTGEKYDNSIPYNKYIENAYDKTILYDTLISNGYDIGMYVNKVFLPSNSADKFKNVVDKSEKPSSCMKLGLMMYKSTAFSYFPHIVKDKFWFYSDDFNKYIDTSSVDTSSAQYSPDDIKFYNALISEGLTFDNDAYAFRIYHLYGVHAPYTMTAQLTYDKNGTSVMEESLASLEVVLEYIDQLKKAGVYEKTSIIVMGDHGGTEYRQNPMLMIKPINRVSEFNISSAPISFDDILNTMLFLATGSTKYEPNVFSWSENDIRTRKYLYYNWDDSWDKDYLPDIYEYYVGGDSAEMVQMERTGTVYTSEGAVKNNLIKVSLGENLPFANGGKIQDAFVYGFSYDEKSHVWSLGNNAKLSFVLDRKEQKEEKLDVSFKILSIYGGTQRIKCFVNGTFIGEKTVNSIAKPISFTFSSSLISDTGLLELELDYPDAFQAENSKEHRVLAFAFEQMKIDYARNLLDFVKVDEESLAIDFSENGASDILINEGWHGQEKSKRWTSEKADICFIAEKARDYLITVECVTYSNSGNSHVLYNGEEIALWNKNTKVHTESIILPAKLYNKGGKQTVTFITDDAKSPLESGASKDKRVLGISVKSITLSVQKP